MHSSKSITVYRNKNGEVERQEVGSAPPPALSIHDKGVNYHQRIINTYHELECDNKLGDMKPKTKSFVRDVHTYAQEPGYWGPEGE